MNMANGLKRNLKVPSLHFRILRGNSLKSSGNWLKLKNSKASSQQKSWKPSQNAKSRWRIRNGTRNSAGSLTSDGFLVVAGKDTVSNEVLVKKYTTQEDVVFHAEITGAPFVVIKAEGKPISEQALREAGEFAASYSRAWRENAGSADVYWVKVDQLSKSGPSGESVPHGAFFVVGKRNWMRNVPLRVAVGIIVGEETSFVGGPVDAVKAKTKAYVVIVPGDTMGKDLLKQILKSLMLKAAQESNAKKQAKPRLNKSESLCPTRKEQ